MRFAITVSAAFLLMGCGADDDDGAIATAITPDVTVASLNVLHGLFCPPETADCRVEARMDLVFDWVESINCPDILIFQEILGPQAEDLVRRAAATRCPVAYEVHEPPARSQNFTLSRYPVVEANEDGLVGGIRSLWHVRVDHPVGVVDVFNTHLAAGIDAGSSPCSQPCPPACVAAGAVTNRDCQAVEIADLVERRAAPGSLRVLAGDFNAEPGSFVYRHLIDDNGWRDTYLLAGNPECDPESGVGCTSGREDEALLDLESPRAGVDRRIDFLLIQGQRSGACRYRVDSARDRDGDGFATAVFADRPNPFAPDCGPFPLPICWPSDHEGIQADINCLPSTPDGSGFD